MSRCNQSSVHSACDPDHWSALVQVARSYVRVQSLRLYTFVTITQFLDQKVIETVILFDLTIHLFDLTMSVIVFQQNFSKSLQEGEEQESRELCKLYHNS